MGNHSSTLVFRLSYFQTLTSKITYKNLIKWDKTFISLLRVDFQKKFSLNPISTHISPMFSILFWGSGEIFDVFSKFLDFPTALNQVTFKVRQVIRVISYTENNRQLWPNRKGQFVSKYNLRILDKVSLLGVDSLWGDCMFIPADWGSL